MKSPPIYAKGSPDSLSLDDKKGLLAVLPVLTALPSTLHLHNNQDQKHKSETNESIQSSTDYMTPLDLSHHRTVVHDQIPDSAQSVDKLAMTERANMFEYNPLAMKSLVAHTSCTQNSLGIDKNDTPNKPFEIPRENAHHAFQHNHGISTFRRQPSTEYRNIPRPAEALVISPVTSLMHHESKIPVEIPAVPANRDWHVPFDRDANSGAKENEINDMCPLPKKRYRLSMEKNGETEKDK